MMQMTSKQISARDYLRNKGVIFGIKTLYENGKKLKPEVMKMKLTKKDQFYRINGVIVSRNMALEIARLGWVEV